MISGRDPMMRWYATVLLVFTGFAAAEAASDHSSAKVGGACDYRAIPGTATITSVAKTAASEKQAGDSGGPGYAGFDVEYTFAPSTEIEDVQARDWAARPHTLLLTNSWYPGPQFLAKYNVAAGATFSAVLKVITKGTCTPFLIDFPDIDLSDYSETA